MTARYDMLLNNDLFKAIWACIHCFDESDTSRYWKEEDEKFPGPPLNYDENQKASDILSVMETAEKPGHDLQVRVEQIVKATTWKETLARAVLLRLEQGLRDGVTTRGALKEAFDKATEAASQFAREHPVYTTLIALGILVVLLPWVIEALGFAELGPIEGSFAAWWQSRYIGYVPKGSLFSFFQRLGMVWRR